MVGTQGDFPALDDILEGAAAAWDGWRRRHPHIEVRSDEYVAALGSFIEEIIPKDDVTLKRLVIDDRVWNHEHGLSERTPAGSVLAAVWSLIVERIEAQR